MKVVILNQIPEVNNKYTFSLARGLKKEGMDVIVCGIEDDDTSAYNDIEYIGLFKNYSKINNLMSKVISYKKSWDRVFRYCVDEKIDILHVQWYILSPMDWLYLHRLKIRGIKIVATIHDLLPFNKKVYDYFFHRKIYREADRVISQARTNENILIDKFGVKKDKIVYIPHGHYMDFVEKATKKESLEYLNLPQDRPIILFFGQIKKVKGVGVLIKSMKEVVEKYPNALCLIAGKVWHDDFSEYEKLIIDLNLEKNIRTDIRFIKDDEIKYYFNAADIVALPYLQIYQSGVVLLGVAYEKPIVATLKGEFLTVIKDRETGLLVQANNSKELAKALIWYLDNKNEAIDMALAAKKDVKVRLSWDSIAKEIHQEYIKVVSKN